MEAKPADLAPSQVIDIDPDEVSALLSSGDCLLIDVREPGEFEAERIPGAMLFPLTEFDPKFIPFEAARRIVFHCGTGKRSHDAATRARGAAKKGVYHLAGGIRAWKDAGLATISFDPDTGEWRQARSA